MKLKVGDWINPEILPRWYGDHRLCPICGRNNLLSGIPIPPFQRNFGCGLSFTSDGYNHLIQILSLCGEKRKTLRFME